MRTVHPDLVGAPSHRPAAQQAAALTDAAKLRGCTPPHSRHTVAAAAAAITTAWSIARTILLYAKRPVACCCCCICRLILGLQPDVRVCCQHLHREHSSMRVEGRQHSWQATHRFNSRTMAGKHTPQACIGKATARVTAEGTCAVQIHSIHRVVSQLKEKMQNKAFKLLCSVIIAHQYRA